MADLRQKLVNALLTYTQAPAKQVSQLTPWQARTMASTLMGDKSPITEKNIRPYDIAQIEDVINATREQRAARNLDESKQRFNQGSGYVNYDLMNEAGMGHSDFSMLPSAGVHNTLGQFTYKTLPNGDIQVQDTYDFLNDNPGNLTTRQADTARYKNLNTLEKLYLLGKETINPYDEQGMKIIDSDSPFGQIGQGFSSLASRFGNAFIGDKGRDVNITFHPKKPLLTQEQIFENNPEIQQRYYENYPEQRVRKTEYVK